MKLLNATFDNNSENKDIMQNRQKESSKYFVIIHKLIAKCFMRIFIKET